jgi:hypothetical protein
MRKHVSGALVIIDGGEASRVRSSVFLLIHRFTEEAYGTLG